PFYFLLPKICVVTLAELLAGFGSKLGELATAVFVIDVLFADPESFTVTITVAEAPLAIFPRSQVIVPTWPTAGTEQDAPLEFSETNVDGAGTGSTKLTAAARNGPRFLTVTVETRFSVDFTAVRLAFSVTNKSDLFCTVMLADPADPELLPVF